MKTPFQIAIINLFSFLEGRGFNLVKDEQASVRYESAKSFVVIDRDYRSGEMNVWFGLRAKKETKEVMFSLTDLLDMEKSSSPLAVRPFEVYSDKELTPFVKEMASETQNYAGHALEGDQEYFHRLSEFRVARGKGVKLPQLP